MNTKSYSRIQHGNQQNIFRLQRSEITGETTRIIKTTMKSMETCSKERDISNHVEGRDIVEQH